MLGMVYDLAANVALLGAAIAALIKFFDWALSDQQKEKLTNYTIRAWYFLDQIKKRHAFQWLTNQRVQTTILVLVALILYLGWIDFYLDAFSADHEGKDAAKILWDGINQNRELKIYVGGAVVLFVAGAMASLPIGLFVIRYLSRQKSLLAYFVTATLLYVGSTLIFVVAWVSLFVRFQRYAPWWGTWITDIEFWLFNIIIFFGVALGTINTLAILLFAYAIASIFVVAALTGILVLGEFIVRRTAEYSAGVVLALSVVVAAVAAVTKYITS